MKAVRWPPPRGAKHLRSQVYVYGKFMFTAMAAKQNRWGQKKWQSSEGDSNKTSLHFCMISNWWLCQICVLRNRWPCQIYMLTNRWPCLARNVERKWWHNHNPELCHPCMRPLYVLNKPSPKQNTYGQTCATWILKNPLTRFFKTFAGLNPNIHRNGNVLLTGRELNASGRQGVTFVSAQVVGRQGVTLVCAQVVRRQGVKQAKLFLKPSLHFFVVCFCWGRLAFQRACLC